MTKAASCTVNSPSKLKLSWLMLVQVILFSMALGVGWADLRHEIRNLGTDRWTATDDRMYMRQLELLNPSLIVPKHERVTSTGSDDKP